MSSLSELLKDKVIKRTKDHSPQPKVEKLEKEQLIEKVDLAKTPKTFNVEKNEYTISDEDLEKVRASVEKIDMTGKTRSEIIIGMYGSIKNPQTGKRFVIPGIDFMISDYTYKYAEMMRTLVDKPVEFTRIMNWE